MRTSENAWRNVDGLARRQRGLITRAQLLASGFTASTVRTAREHGRLTALHPGVFRVMGTPTDYEQLVLGATMRTGASSAASHRSAAHLWDLRRERDHVEITVPPANRRSPRNVTLHRSCDLDPNHFTVRRGIPATKPARTLVDLAAVLRTGEMAEIVDRALMRGLVDQAGLRVAIAELARPGREGPAVVRRLLDHHPLGNVRPESVLEPVMAALVRTTGVAEHVVYQHPVVVCGHKYRLDFAAPHVKLAIEVLGLHEHGTRQAILDDAERRRLLAVAGWQVVEYTKDAMTRSPTLVAREIAQLIADREHLLASLGLLAAAGP